MWTYICWVSSTSPPCTNLIIFIRGQLQVSNWLRFLWFLCESWIPCNLCSLLLDFYMNILDLGNLLRLLQNMPSPLYSSLNLPGVLLSYCLYVMTSYSNLKRHCVSSDGNNLYFSSSQDSFRWWCLHASIASLAKVIYKLSVSISKYTNYQYPSP